MFDPSNPKLLSDAFDDSPLTANLTGDIKQVASDDDPTDIELLGTDMLVVCFGDEGATDAVAAEDDTSAAPPSEQPQSMPEGVIDLGDTGMVTDISPFFASSTDNSGRPPSVVNDNPEIGYLFPCFCGETGQDLTGAATDDVLVGTSGFDTISGLSGDDFLRGKGGGDLMRGGGGDDRIHGNSGGDFIRGNGGDDTIRAGVGADRAKGGDGADLINGGAGADFLIGGRGDDTLIGGAGDDALKGNEGADVFRFRASDRNETILDFEQGQDRIEIRNGAAAFDDLSIRQTGADILISFGQTQITIISDDATLFDAGDFIF